MGTSVRAKNPFLFNSLVKLKHLHRKYSRKPFSRRRFPKCKRCNLTVENLQKLGKLRGSYTYHIQEQNRHRGISNRRKHAHMHTRPQPGINVELTDDLTKNFTWSPPFATVAAPSTGDADDESLAGPESVTVDELEKAFTELEPPSVVDPSLDGGEVLEGHVYDLEELRKVDECVAPSGFGDELLDLSTGEGSGGWSIEALLTSKGVSKA